MQKSLDVKDGIYSAAHRGKKFKTVNPDGGQQVALHVAAIGKTIRVRYIVFLLAQRKHMQKDDIDDELKDASFDYFYWYSRFEFALKENKYLKDHRTGVNAEPSWEEFRERYKAEYVVSNEAGQLIKLHPKRQVVSEHGGLDWRPVGVLYCENDICRVITMLKAVRNNLFHGGKHGDVEVDDRKRNFELLKLSKVVLDQLAQMANFESDYKRCY